MTIDIPVSNGDTAYLIIVGGDGRKHVISGQISAISFSPDMRLFVKIKGRRPVEWGVKAFKTLAEAQRAADIRISDQDMTEARKNAVATMDGMIDFIRKRLKDTGTKQVQLCEKTGLSRTVVSNYLSASRTAVAINFLSVLEALGIDTFDMFYSAVDRMEESENESQR